MPERGTGSAAEDHAVLCTAVRQAGEIARRYFQTDYKKWDKGGNDPVTEADYAVNAHLRRALMGARPSYGWLSEESEDDRSRLDHRKVWVVDPIDGTRAFVKGVAHFAISAALVAGGVPVCAVIYNPVSKAFYDARTGGGARLNGQAIRVSTQNAVEQCRMLGDQELFRNPKWTRKWPPMQIESRNSIALRLAMVASGEWDACLTLARKSDWDIAAGDLIVREAGGVVTDHHGAPFLYNQPETRHRSVVAAGPALHGLLIERVKHIQLSAS